MGKYFRVHYPILISLHGNEVTDAMELVIKETVADYLNVGVEVITLDIEFFADDVMSTSIVISVDIEDYATMEFMVESMDGTLAVELAAATDASVSNEAATHEEVEEEVEFTTTSGADTVGKAMSFFVFMFLYLFCN